MCRNCTSCVSSVRLWRCFKETESACWCICETVSKVLSGMPCQVRPDLYRHYSYLLVKQDRQVMVERLTAIFPRLDVDTTHFGEPTPIFHITSLQGSAVPSESYYSTRPPRTSTMSDTARFAEEFADLESRGAATSTESTGAIVCEPVRESACFSDVVLAVTEPPMIGMLVWARAFAGGY